jgi:hypothetical protein
MDTYSRAIRAGSEGKYYEVFKYKPFTEDDIVNDLIHEKGSIIISQYGLSQITGIFAHQNGTESIPSIKIFYGNISIPMASVMSIVEFMKHKPILVKLKEVEKPDGKDIDKISNTFPFFKICDYNLCISDGDFKKILADRSSIERVVATPPKIIIPYQKRYIEEVNYDHETSNYSYKRSRASRKKETKISGAIKKRTNKKKV